LLVLPIMQRSDGFLISIAQRSLVRMIIRCAGEQDEQQGAAFNGWAGAGDDALSLAKI
jgi:hypothetical protein